MSCPSSIIPGFEETSRVKDKALEMKISSLLSQPKKKKKVSKRQKR